MRDGGSGVRREVVEHAMWRSTWLLGFRLEHPEDAWSRDERPTSLLISQSQMPPPPPPSYRSTEELNALASPREDTLTLSHALMRTLTGL